MLHNEVRSVVDRYLSNVRSSGPTNVLATCPFHRHKDGSPERTPSFAMSLETGLFLCHSCKEKGNLRQFLLAVGVSRTTVDKQYGLLIDELTKLAPPKRIITQLPQNTYEPLPESLLGLFDYLPLDLINKGFTESTLRAFDVGFDKANNRITFPLRDLRGRLVGISGRSVVDSYNRFKIYDVEYTQWGLPIRKTSLFGLLWNVDRLYTELYFGTNQSIVVVEGYKACMWVHQKGIRNVVALCGSHLNEGQQWVLEHLGVPVYLMLDNDRAGRDGTKSAAKALGRSLPTYIVRYDGAQPDVLSEEEINKAVSSAQESHLWLIEESQKEDKRWHMENNH